MKSIINFLALLVMAVAIVALPAGCNSPRFESGTTGAYHGDLAFYSVDSAAGLAESTLDFVFKFERDNRAMLWQISPSIKQGLDKIRPAAAKAMQDYAAARKIYESNPLADNLSNLQTVLARLQNLAASAQALLPNSAPSPVK